MMLDTTTEFGARVERRLREERIGWLTTVGRDGAPQPSPIWFLWDGGTFLVYSQPKQLKLGNIERNPKVALHLDSDGLGGNIVVVTGEARIVRDVPPANEIPEYLDKYRSDIARIGMTPESFARAYSVAIRITPKKLRGH